MKKFLISLLGIAFLLPAFAYAGSYCVSFPSSGDSKWTKRDNNIGVRFRFDWDHKPLWQYRPGFYSSTGIPEGSSSSTHIGKAKDYVYHSYGTGELCVYDNVDLTAGSVDYVKPSGLSSGSAPLHLPFTKLRLDVRWGGDCGTIDIKDGSFGGDHRFRIYHRKGDLVNPFGCKRA